jgi:hypothetical protein
MNRRQFALASLPAALLSGCHSEQKPSREATLLHNRAVRDAVAELDQAMNGLDMQVSQFNAENWRDALSNVQTAAVRLRTDVDELKRSLGYADPS